MNSRDGIIGFIVGDAMGVPLEFRTREELMKDPTTCMKEYMTHNQPKGTWSDDTSMTIATMDAIILDKDINYKTIANNFLSWVNNNNYTPHNKVFDIGNGTLRSIGLYNKYKNDNTINPYDLGLKDISNNGNGSLMRILPICYYVYLKKCNDDLIYDITYKISSITHGHSISILGCFIYIKFIINLLEGNDIYTSYNNIRGYNYEKYFSKDIIKYYDRIINNDISKYNLDDIKSSGYIVDTLEAVMHVLLTTSTYDDAIIKAINLGEDTDTVGAITGGAAGVYYGFNNINKEWREQLVKYDYLLDLCDRFDKAIN